MNETENFQFNKEDFYDYIHQKKYEGKNTHNEPAPETRERLTKLETNHQNLMEKIEENQKLNEDAHKAIMVVVEKIDSKLDSALEKKAGIWVEKVLIWLGIVIGGGVLGYIGMLLIKVIEKL